MRPDRRMKEWCESSSSASSGSRRVRSSTSRRQPLRTSSDLHARLCFCPIPSVAAASETARFATLARSFLQESAIWSLSSLILSASYLGRRQLCLEAPPAGVARPVETGTEVTTWMGPSSLPRFPSPCRSALARVSPHPSSRKFAILWAAVAPPAAMSQSTPSAESFVVTCGLPVWKCIEYFKDYTE